MASSTTNIQEALVHKIGQILTSIPAEWRGTTFKNQVLLGREVFAGRLRELLLSSQDITTEALDSLGNAEDYLRVSSNISTLLEFVISVLYGFDDVSQIFTFASRVMPLMAVLLTAPSAATVHLLLGEGSAPFSPEQIALLPLLNCKLQLHTTATLPAGELPSGDIVLRYLEHLGGVETATTKDVDGIVSPFFLYIRNPSKIQPAKVLVIRKRMSSPMSTPMCESLLNLIHTQLSALSFPLSASATYIPLSLESALPAVDSAALDRFYSHLQSMSGAEPSAATPVCCTSGLSTLFSLWTGLITLHAGVDVVMASTAYGGSSELTDLLAARQVAFAKYTFDITGKNEVSPAIDATLTRMATHPESLHATTVLFVEIPTNPDMKVPELSDLVALIQTYKTATQKEVVLLLDTTFAPASRALARLAELNPELITLAFISMSKSVSRGYTTAGTIVAGPHPTAVDILSKVRTLATTFDTTAKPDQLIILSDNHTGVEERCQQAYEVAAAVGQALREAVSTHCGGYDMPLAFVTPAQAALGFTTSTFSFNLPPLSDPTDPEANAKLAQQFVDLLTVHKEFKPCVSFGQDNGLVYATVPATSTQGAIKAEDKAKQAVGGVQLTRLSFPPTGQVDRLTEIITEAITKIYQA